MSDQSPGQPPKSPSETPLGRPQNDSRPRLPALTAAEIRGIGVSLQAMVGAQLQECLQTASELGLGFYHDREMHWLWFDLNPLRPLVVRLVGKPPARKKIQRPLTLFIKSNFVGRRLKGVRVGEELGRVLVLEFHRSETEDLGPGDPCEIECRLFPHGQNVIARYARKSIAENKPKDLGVSTKPAVESEARTWEEIEYQWQLLQAPKAAQVQAAPTDAANLEKQWRRAIEKKEKALERMREELAEKTSTHFSELGEWLKTNGTLDVPREWQEYVDTTKSLSWNIEESFRKSKEGLRKSEGTRARLAAVEAELEKLKSSGPSAFSKQREREVKADAENLLSRADARGRRHKIGDDLEVYVGKSAADNMALLRRAQPFDLWLHLREQPGSHAILRRARSRVVSDAELIEAGRWVVEQSTGKRAAELKGDRFDLLIVECRFVRPIKGDKLGRVNYTNDRVMGLRF